VSESHPANSWPTRRIQRPACPAGRFFKGDCQRRNGQVKNARILRQLRGARFTVDAARRRISNVCAWLSAARTRVAASANLGVSRRRCGTRAAPARACTRRSPRARRYRERAARYRGDGHASFPARATRCRGRGLPGTLALSVRFEFSDPALKLRELCLAPRPEKLF